MSTRGPRAGDDGVAGTAAASPEAGGADGGSTVVRFPGRTARGRRRMRAVTAAGVLALLGALGWMLFASPVLAVDRVQVTGTRVVDRAELERRLEPLRGVPLPRIRTGTVQELVGSVPGVASVRAAALPPTGVEIVVEERPPVARWGGEGAVDVLMGDGSVVEHAPADAVPEGLPEAAPSLRGADERRRAAAASVLQGLPEGVRSAVTGVDAATPDQVRLALRDGSTLVWGDPTRAELKGPVAEAFVRRGGTGPTLGPKQEIDVSVPDRPITR